jgi:SAM-dependent methyltransferase
MRAYATADFRRFVYTWGLAREERGRCLELGGNPYFTTILLRRFTDLQVEVANYFGWSQGGEHAQAVRYSDPADGAVCEEEIRFQHFNIESDRFPYDDGSFDVVIFCEIMEHLLNDPCAVLREIRRVLKPGGKLILTTPNVARLENVSRLVAGANIYDPYSGYGPYGRHNREYTRHELVQLLEFEGFDAAHHFTADVSPHQAAHFADTNKLAPLLKAREADLGQYLFSKSTLKPGERNSKRPGWLYRSYPEGEIV